MNRNELDRLRADTNRLFVEPELNLQANAILDKLESIMDRMDANPTEDQRASMLREAHECMNDIKRLLGEVVLRNFRKGQS